MQNPSPPTRPTPKRAAVVTAFDPGRFRGGIERFTVELASLMEAAGWRCTVCHGGSVAPTAGFANEFLARLHALGRQVAEEAYDLVVCNNFYGLSLFPPSQPTVTVFHATHAGFAEATAGLVDRRTTLEWRWLWGELGDRASCLGRRLVAVSEGVREELAHYYGVDGAAVVEHGVDPDTFAPRRNPETRRALGIPAEATVGIFVGRFDVTKGSDVVTEVVRHAGEVHWLVVTASGAPASALRGLARVTTFHEIEPARLAELYAAADFLLFPSRYEGFGLVILEALACAVPVLATPVGVARSLFRDPVLASFQLPAADAPRDELVAACLARIAELRQDPHRAAAVGRRGRETVLARYTHRHWRANMARALGLGDA